MTTSTYPFTTPTNYTYDSDLIEVTGGVAKLKSQVPANVVAYATYTSSADFNYSTGDLDGTLTLDAVVEDGLLNLAHSNLSYATYDGTPVISADPTKGTIRMQIVAQYTGSPAGARGYYLEGDASANNNKINIYHNAGGLLVCELFNSGGGLGDNPYTAWSPTAGEIYDLEFNWNSVTGLHNIFIDGDLKVSKTVTYTRDDTYLNNIIIGNTQYGADTKVLNFARYDTVQHTSNFTPSDWSEFGETKYSTSNPIISFNSTFTSNNITSYEATETITGSDLITYNWKRSGTWYNHTGSAVEVADGTYTKSALATVLDDNASDLMDDTRYLTGFRAFLHSEDGMSTPELDLVTVNYDSALPDPTAPTEVNIEAFIYSKGIPAANQIIKTRPYKSGYFNGDIFEMREWETIGTTDNDGFFSGIVFQNPADNYLEILIGIEIFKVDLIGSTELDLKDATTFTYLGTVSRVK